ncbi:hypothetical protein FY034_17260 (plasmid) [Trichlorobacter lovleyi]|uniref:hypothetical protein n=1 Tax=Trichlorobacter lovleyi TaxID=313985 RepID=UPI002240AFDF|nr:hypothetical protein [Trichlorobacter lovleyi]QOX80772.1 hypothetical protein FY034_17260 [Trichlorobacter lovleyi]
MDTSNFMLERIDDLLPPALACQISEANQRLEKALAEEKTNQLKAKEMEQKALDLQSIAETKQLEMMIAKDDVVGIHDDIQKICNDQKKAELDHLEALDLLETVKKIVEETAQKKERLKKDKAKKEAEMTPALLRASTRKIEFERHVAMSEIEFLSIKRMLAAAEEGVLRSRLEVAEAKLSILEHPNCADIMPHINGLIEWEGEVVNG